MHKSFESKTKEIASGMVYIGKKKGINLRQGRKSLTMYDFRELLALVMTRGVPTEEAKEYIDMNTTATVAGLGRTKFCHNKKKLRWIVRF